MARTIEFNKADILDQVTDHFWEFGYSNTSMSSIVERTGIQKTSLYRTFGNKEDLFQQSLKNYFHKRSSINKSGLSYIRSFLEKLLFESKGKGLKKGCLIMNSVLELSSLKDSKSLKLANSLWEQIRLHLKEQVEIAQEKNEIKEELDSEILSKWIITQAFTIREFSKITDDPQYFEQIATTIDIYLKNIETKEKRCH